MNEERIDKLIKVLRDCPDGLFTMSKLGVTHISLGRGKLKEVALDAGTPCCIGGWCLRLMVSEGMGDTVKKSAHMPITTVQRYLGLEHDVARALLLPDSDNNNYGLTCHNNTITRPMAILALENVRRGCEDWEVWDDCCQLRDDLAAKEDAQ